MYLETLRDTERGESQVSRSREQVLNWWQVGGWSRRWFVVVFAASPSLEWEHASSPVPIRLSYATMMITLVIVQGCCLSPQVTCPVTP